MSKVIFDSGISLDGFFAGYNRGPNNPMGGVSGKIHLWTLNQAGVSCFVPCLRATAKR